MNDLPKEDAEVCWSIKIPLRQRARVSQPVFSFTPCPPRETVEAVAAAFLQLPCLQLCTEAVRAGFHHIFYHGQLLLSNVAIGLRVDWGFLGSMRTLIFRLDASLVRTLD